jgi:dihydrofolate reductase
MIENENRAVPKMAVHGIGATTADNVVGINGRLPWKFGTQKADMARFKALTTGNIVIMGSKTYESMGSKALKDRYNIVISRRVGYQVDGETILVNSPERALQIASQLFAGALMQEGNERAMTAYVIGGSEIWSKFLEMDVIDVFHMTVIATTVYAHGDNEYVIFPGMPDWPYGWRELNEEVHQPSEGNIHGYRFVDLLRCDPVADVETASTAPASLEDKGWVRMVDDKPKEYGKYEVYRAGCKKQQYQTWNNTGWAYDNKDITHWRRIVPPTKM